MKTSSNVNSTADSGNPELILVTGDLNIPNKCLDIHTETKKLLQLKKFQHILCTGNIGSRDSYEYLKSLCNNPNSNFHCVKGENPSLGDDYPGISLSEMKTVKIGEFTITLISGHQIVPWGDYEALSSIQKQTNCDILISGYTHKSEVVNYEGKYFINPGSLTGAYSPLNNDPQPGFMVLVISADVCILYQYEMNSNMKSLDVKKVEINKNKSE
jgi:vacuolar protein sorting-associated protein 29